MPRTLLLSLLALCSIAHADQTSFIQGQTAAAIRNNYSGYVGMQFTVGSSAMNVTSLGRVILPGNNQTHSVKLVDARSGVDVPGGVVQLTMVAGTTNGYQYATLPTPVTLTAGESYFLVSQEFNGGDTWYDYTPVTSTTDASINGPVYLGSGGNYVLVSVTSPTSWSFVPANFQYSLGAVTAPPSVSITQPVANATLSGSATIAATASAASGLSITSVNFKLNGSTQIGAAVTIPPYQVTLDTTAYADGAYTLTSTAIDSAGNQTTSAAVSVSLVNGNVPVGTSFVQSASFGAVRNNYSGFVGMQISVGAQALTVTALGRIFVAGNTSTHTVKLVNATTGQDIPGGSIEVAMAGGSPLQFKSSMLPSALTLPASSSYYLVSQETSGGDQWYDYGPLSVTSVATVPGAIYSSGANYVLVPAPAYGYVPLSFLYGAGSTQAPPSVAVTSPSAGSISGTVTFGATATASTSLQITSLQLLLDGAPFGSAMTTVAQFSTISLSLATSTLSSGTHSLAAVATDSSGRSTTSATVLVAVNNGGAPALSPLITAQSLAGALRSNFSGAVGMELQVGSSPITVLQVGRFCATGNSQVHIVKLVQTNGSDVPGGSASVPMAGCVPGAYTYGSLSSSIKLQSNTSYFLVSLETTGGDQWYDYAPVTASSVATIPGAVYSPGSNYVVVPSPGSSYVPVNLEYQTSTTSPPSITITSPAASATVSGVLTITANAVAASGLSIPSVQFQENGINIGAAVTGSGATFSTQIDTTTLSNGSYGLIAIATDSAGNSATSALVTVTVSNAVSSAGQQPFITQQSPGAIRNNFSGYVGMKFNVGGASFTVSQLGRMCVAGNGGTHIVKLVNSDGSDIAGGSINLQMAGCTPGAYRYGALTSTVGLSANTSYYLLSLETNGGDQWYDYGQVTSQAQGSVNGPVYVAGGNFNLVQLTGNSFVPVNFLFVAASTAKPIVKFASPAPSSTVGGTITIAANVTAAPGLTISTVQFQRTGSNIGPPVTGAGPNYAVTLDTRTLQNGNYNLTAVAIDSAGGSTFSAIESVTVLNNIAAPSVVVTTPKTGFTASGMLSVTATAAPSAGVTVTSLQLTVDGQSFGAPCAAGTCSAVLDTTLLSSGSHRLAATAIDSDEGHATSSPVAFQSNNPVTGIGLLNGFMPGLARNYGDWIGMQFTTGCTALSVNALGRIYMPGNVGSHKLKLVQASDGTDVPGGSATVSFTGAIANRITYAPLAAPLTLAANTAFYLVSQETTTGDQFYDFEPALTMGAAAINGPAYMQSGVWITPSNPNFIYVPVDFKFTVPGVPFPTPTTPMGGIPSAGKGVAIVPASVNHVLVTGQSLSNGATGGPPLTVTQPYSDTMLAVDNSSFLPLVEGTGSGYQVDPNLETIGSALGDTLTALSQNLSFTDIVTNAGFGGASYTQLAKGSAPYAAAIAQFNAAKSLSAAADKTYKVSAIAVIHGETDEGLRATSAAYEADLVQWQSNYQTDGRAISGQSDNVPFFIDQENSWTTGNLATPTVALGQLSAAEDNPTSIFLIGPKYQYHYNDGVHMDNLSYRQEGELFGKEMKAVLLDGSSPKPFAPKSVTRSGNLVTVLFNVPSPPLQFDTYTVLPKSAMGFEYSDGSACSPFIVGAQITAGDTVTLTLSSTPAGSNEHVRYALTGIAGSSAGRDQPGSAHGNLKDSDPTVSSYGDDLSNWAVSFDKIVNSPQ